MKVEIRASAWVPVRHFPAWKETGDSSVVSFFSAEATWPAPEWVKIGEGTFRTDHFDEAKCDQEAIGAIEEAITKLRAETEARITVLEETKQSLLAISFGGAK